MGQCVHRGVARSIGLLVSGRPRRPNRRGGSPGTEGLRDGGLERPAELTVTSIPMSVLKNSCVGNLQLFMQAEAHPISSKYLHRSTFTPGSVRTSPSADDSTSTVFSSVSPMSHLHAKAVIRAFMCSESSGRGLANMALNAGGSQLGKSDWSTTLDLD